MCCARALSPVSGQDVDAGGTFAVRAFGLCHVQRSLFVVWQRCVAMAGSAIREGCFLQSEPVFLVTSPLFGLALRVLFFLTEQSEPRCFYKGSQTIPNVITIKTQVLLEHWLSFSCMTSHTRRDFYIFFISSLSFSCREGERIGLHQSSGHFLLSSVDYLEV